jgi:hypothetical protein
VNNKKRELLLQELERQVLLFRKAINALSVSYNKCRTIGRHRNYSEEQLESLEALTARFARASDLLTQKIFGLFDALELEERGTVIDRINRAEKRGMLKSAGAFQEIRELRNEIAHEYAAEDLNAIFRRVLKLTPILLDTLPAVEKFAKKYLPSAHKSD